MPAPASAGADMTEKLTASNPKHRLVLAQLGGQVRALRQQRGLTRKMLAASSQVSERHLANLENGVGNVSILVLNDIAQALDLPLAYFFDTPIPGLPNKTAAAGVPQKRKNCLALIGLRGAGKSTLGKTLAADLGYDFIEMSGQIEQLAGCDVAEIHKLYGMTAYRRYERQAIHRICIDGKRADDSKLDDAQGVVLATPGGVVADAISFELILRHCTTVWLQAKPLDHLARVREQGDNRPMMATRTTHRAAIDDLKAILEVRNHFYAMADMKLNTSAYELKECSKQLLKLIQGL